MLGSAKTAVMKRNLSSAAGSRLDNTPKWDVIQTCIINIGHAPNMEQIMNDQTPSTDNPVSTPSSGLRIILAFLLLIVFFPYDSPAPIYGFFPGMSALLERADAVVVADIAEQSGKNYFGGGDDFKIRIRKVMKGEAKEGQTYSAYLRDLGFYITQTNRCRSLFPEGLRRGATGVFFLQKSDHAEPKVEFRNENCEGDAFSISPNADLKKLPGLKSREAVELLLKDALAYYGERFPDYKTAVSKMLASP